jgi:hypothetical protein
MQQQEIWKDIPGYEGKYQVSNLGNVKSLSRIVLRHGKYPFLSKEKILKTNFNNTNYLVVNLYKNNKSKTITIHKLVAIAFLNHMPDVNNELVIDHINNIQYDNRLENLQIITQRENTSKDRKNKTSKYTGVFFVKKINKWVSTIRLKKERIYIGCFDKEEEASLAYRETLENYKNNNIIPSKKN